MQQSAIGFRNKQQTSINLKIVGRGENQLLLRYRINSRSWEVPTRSRCDSTGGLSSPLAAGGAFRRFPKSSTRWRNRYSGSSSSRCVCKPDPFAAGVVPAPWIALDASSAAPSQARCWDIARRQCDSIDRRSSRIGDGGRDDLQMRFQPRSRLGKEIEIDGQRRSACRCAFPRAIRLPKITPNRDIATVSSF